MPAYAAYKEAFVGVAKPFAFLDLELFEENIQAVLKRAGTKALRVASKSIRCAPILKRIFASSPRMKGILGYSPKEALFLSEKGFDDIVIGYPTLQPALIRPLLKESARGKRITFMVDLFEHAVLLNVLAKDLGVQAGVCLDVDMSYALFCRHLGAWRSSLSTKEQIASLAQRLLELPFVRIDGLMGYEAQIAGVPDRLKGRHFKNLLIRLLKALSKPDVARRRKDAVDVLAHRGIALGFVNAGGTGSLESSSAEDWVSEVTAGSGFYGPHLFNAYRGFSPKPALGFALEVARNPRPGVYTLSGGGYVASGTPGWEKLPSPYLPAGVRLSPTEGAGEVQTPVFYKGKEMLSLGDPVFFRHAKAGELLEHFNSLYLVSNGRVVDEIPTYRGEGQAFL
jgi:D-serine deaminase-like pyridoxal phosphate-dependent protein